MTSAEQPPLPPLAYSVGSEPSSDAPQPAYTEREQRLLDEHQYDTCEVEMGVCTGGCRPSCPPAYCTSERHKVHGVVWPCNVAAPILGFRNADAYWQAKAEALDAFYAKPENQHV